MKILPICLLAAVSLLPHSWAKPLDIIAEDSADVNDYGSGWSDGSGGSAFGKWKMQTNIIADANSHAGFYVASTSEKQDLKGAAINGKAFGMYANGVGFESATAFRAFNKPLKVGQSFSFLMEHGDIVKKFDMDGPGDGSIGLTLRSSTDATGTDDYNKESRFEIGYYKEDSSYAIYDGDGKKSLDIPLSGGALAVTLTLVSADVYNLEITVIASKETTHLNGRKLGGTAGTPVASFCLFDRNGEANDAYFNGFQVLQAAH